MKNVVRSSFLAGVTLLCWSAASHGQVSSRVIVDQLSRPLTSASASPQPVSSSSREAGRGGLRTGAQGASTAPAPEVVEACREAGLRGGQVKGVDCAAILQAADAQLSQPSGEGTLLQMFGQRANVTGAQANRPVAGTDADAVARQLSSGDPQGNGAAGVAIRNRDAPPPSRPR